MITRKGHSEGVVSRGPTAQEASISLHVERADDVLDVGETAEVEELDTVYDVGETAEYNIGYDIVPTPEGCMDCGEITSESLNTGVATVSAASGRHHVTMVGEGRASVVLRHKMGAVRWDGRVWNVPSGEFKAFNRYADGSLAKHIGDSVDALIEGKTPATSKPLFTTINHSTATYLRNQNCWANGLAGLTGFSVWNSATPKKHATAITPEHVIFCGHWPLSEGSTVRFVTANNQVVERTLAKVKREPTFVSVFGTAYPDFQIARLNEPLPASIEPLPLLPSDYVSYLPSRIFSDVGGGWYHNWYYIPGVVTDQDCNALLFRFSMITYKATSIYYDAQPVSTGGNYDPTQFPVRASFGEAMIDKDSGNPMCLVINGQLVLLSAVTTPGPKGTAFHEHIAMIDQLIDDVGRNGLSLSYADLSGFTDYSGVAEQT
jgi:hypothetical protein